MIEDRMPWEEAVNNQQKAEVTIKFGKGLVGESFTTKNGKEVVEVKIPESRRRFQTLGEFHHLSEDDSR